jgi:hypothetical protein
MQNANTNIFRLHPDAGEAALPGGTFARRLSQNKPGEYRPPGIEISSMVPRVRKRSKTKEKANLGPQETRDENKKTKEKGN